MQNILSFFRNKKTFVLFFLVLATAGIIIPQLAIAEEVSKMTSEFAGLGMFLQGAINGFIYAVGFIWLLLSSLAVDISALLLKGFTAIAGGGILSYTHSTVVNLGWPRVRNLANMVIVLGFIVIGVSTALRFKDYEAKKLLGKLIIAALLINFSLLICGIAIDASNIMVVSLLKGNLVGERAQTAMHNSVVEVFKDTWASDPITFLAKVIATVIGNILTFVVILLFAMLFFLRIFALWALVILSPLAFVFSVFPFTKKFYDLWLSNFTQWCLIGIPAAFFLWLATNLGNDQTLIVNNIPGGGGSLPGIIDQALSFFVPAIFLVVGFLFSMQFSAMGSSLVKSAGAKIKAGGMATGKFAARATGVNTDRAGKQISRLGSYMQSKGGAIGKAGWAVDKFGKTASLAGGGGGLLQKTRSGAGRIGELMGGIPEGTDALRKSEELKKTQGRMSALISQGKLDKVLETSEGRGAGTNPMQRGAAIGALLESKNFDSSNVKHIEGLDVLQEQGGDLSKYIEKNRSIAGFSKSAVANTIAKNPGMSKDKARELVSEDAYKGISEKKMEELRAGEVNEHLLTMIDHTSIASTAHKYSPDLKAAYKKYQNTTSPEFISADAKRNRLLATGNPEDLIKANRIRDNILEIQTNPNL